MHICNNMASFTGLFEPTAAPRWKGQNFNAFLKDQFTLSTLLLTGALIQGVLVLVGGRLALLPAVAAVFIKFADIYAQKTGLRRNKAADNVILHKFSAQIPNSDGDYGSVPAKADMCVFLIGARCTGPLGMFEPGFKELGDRFRGMVNHLQGMTALTLPCSSSIDNPIQRIPRNGDY